MNEEPINEFEKIEKKIKLSNLLSGKKFADLELQIGKLEEKLNEISSDFPKIRDRTEEIENLLNVINLGLVDYKKKFENINARFETIEKVPENVKKSMFEYEKKLKVLSDEIKNLSTNLGTLKNLKEEVTQVVDEKISSQIQVLKTTSESNKMEIEHIKRDLDAFSSSVKSFERTVQLTNLDKLIERFDTIDRKIRDTQLEVEKFRKTFTGVTFTDTDIRSLKEGLNNLSSTVMDKLSELNELQTSLNIITQKMDDLNFFETIGKLKSDLKEKESMILDDRTNIEELRARIDRISAMGVERLQPIRGIDKDVQEKMAGLDVASVEELVRRSEEMYKDMIRRVSELKDLDKKLDVIESDARSRTLPPDVNEILTKIHERLENVEDRYNQVLNVLKSEVKNIKSEISKPEIKEMKKKIGGLEKILDSIDKDLSNYRKQMEERVRSIEKRKNIKIPNEIVDDINSLKNTVSLLTADNKELRRSAREIRIAQMDTITSKAFTGLVNRIKALEEKIIDFEKSAIKEKPVEIAVTPEMLDSLSERIKVLENKMIDFEKSTGMGSLAQKKEYVSLMNLKADLEKEINDIKKKMTEGYSVQPVILE